MEDTIRLGKLVALTEQAKRLDVWYIAKTILEDAKFNVWSGSSKPHQHHYGKGGLIIHTAEVIDLCFLTNVYYKNPVPQDQLFLAALFHDSGKMFDYQPVDSTYADWTSAPHKRKIHHISRSGIIWSKAVERTGLQSYKQMEEDVLHAILSHHGLREWGSPVSPVNKMAWILHLCDNISARIDDCEKFDRFDHNKKQ